MHRIKFVFATALLLATPLLLTACKTEGRRIGLGETTQAELASPKVLPAALIEFSSQAPQRLVADLSDLPLIEVLNEPATIILGDIENKTQIVSSNEFEIAMERFRDQLLNSRIARDELTFVADRSRLARLAQREEVVGPEGQPAAPDPYDETSTFALLGNFNRIARGGVNQYFMQFQLVHFGTNQLIWSDRYEVKQVQGEE